MSFLNSVAYVSITIRLWNEGDHEDRRIFAYERERGYYSSPVFSPLCSLLADILLYKLFPPIFASCTLYSLLGLKSTWRAWGRFVGALWLMQIAGACFCKVRPSLKRVMLDRPGGRGVGDAPSMIAPTEPHDTVWV